MADSRRTDGRRPRARAPRQQEKLRHQSLYDQVPVGLYRASADGRILEANATLAQMLGYATREELLRVNAIDLYVDAGDRAELLAQLSRDGTTRLFQTRLRRTDGTERWVEISATAECNADGRVSHLDGSIVDVTERKRAEDATRISEGRYRKLFDNMLGGFAYCRMLFDHGKPHDFVYLEVNPAFETLTGLKDVVGRKVSEVIPGIRETSSDLFKIYGRVATTGNPERFETYVEALGIWFAISVYCPEQGHFVAVFDNITERKRAESERKQSLEELSLFRALIDRSNDAIEVVDPLTGRILDANERASRNLGYTREELLSLHVPDVDPAADESSFRLAIEKLRKSGALVWEGMHRRKDGSTFPVEVNISLVHLGREYAVAVVRDISERVRVETDRARLSAAVEQAAEGVIITDTAGAIQFVNPAFTRMTGYSLEDVRGQNPRILKSGKQDAAFYRAMWDTLTRGEAWRGKLVNRRRDGTEYHAQAAIFPLREASGAVVAYVGISHDMTREMELESQLRQAQKMEAVGMLAGGIAHDFNNLLGAITMFGELIAADMAATDPRREDLDSIQGAVARATTLTRQLLAFSRQQVLRPRVLDPNTVITDVLKILGRLIGEDIELITQLTEGAGLVRADEGQLEQVLLNLAVNARDAMPGGGRLTIATTSATLDEDAARPRGIERGGDYVILTITDTGTGMTPEVRARVFEPFFSTKGAKGTGLGLATVYGIVRQSGGQVAVASEPGQGSTFTIHLPRVTGLTAEMPVAVEESDAAGGSETILLAEDDPGVRMAASTVLARLGYDVLIARSGEEALTKAQAHEGQIHLVVSDVVMPGMTGLELVQRLRQASPGLRALLMSGYAGDAMARHGVVESGTPFIEKPFTSSSLAAKVRQILDDGATPAAG